MVSFNASISNESVDLSWVTATELNNRGFEVERSIENNSKRTEYEKIGFVDGYGTTASQQVYSFSDKQVSQPGRYFYRLKQVDYDGSFEYSTELAVDVNKPLVFNLDQNYPNPFNPSTTIKYSVPVTEHVTIKVFDILGNEVTTLVNEQKEAATYEITFDASQLSSGVYFYKINAGSFSDTKKLMLMK
ncbi:MAG: T9SS type A sorting domain-containing protein [Ignavibacteriales bacterium]|nr:MAG: T9SS type A sorting domain-containing protein [Ignavibacteriales bacterium]